MRGAEAGMMIVGALLAGGLIGAVLGAIFGATGPFVAAGICIGLFGGVALVIARFRDL